MITPLVTPPVSTRLAAVLIHGYALLDRRRNRLLAGSGMSGLALQNTLLAEGLGPTHRVGFLTGRVAARARDEARPAGGPALFEYDARFPELLERGGRFRPELADLWYRTRVEQPDNPVYRGLEVAYGRVLRRFRPVLVNPHNLNAVVACIRAMARRRGPRPRVLATVHDLEARQLAFASRHQRWVDRFVAPSRAVQEGLRDAGIDARRIRAIPNGLDPLWAAGEPGRRQGIWRALARREGLSPRCRFQVLVAARRVPGKGIEYAIEGFRRYRRSAGPGARLLITGAEMADPDYEAVLHAQAAGDPDIRLLGPLRYAELPALMAASRACILPSIQPEGFGFANLEAMAAGCLAVAVRQGGVLDYLKDGVNGRLVPPHDAQAIARVLGWADREAGEVAAISRAARATASLYTAERTTRAYEAAIAELLAGRGP